MNLLACDLGGTKTVIGIYTFDKGLKLLYKKLYKSQEWSDFDLIINDFLINIPEDINRPDYGCIGVAGHISAGKAKITNIGWILNKDNLKQSFNLKEVILINDFSVLIYGIDFIKESQYLTIQSSNQKSDPDNKYIAIIGAGTGLGIARGLITQQKIFTLPSEGGHREYSPRSKEEWELCQWIRKELGVNRISIERVVSGKGLATIARWRLNKTDAISHPITQILRNSHIDKEIDLGELVTDYAKKGDQIMTEVLELWLSAYGSAIGDLALQELCTSGLWIAGGVAAKIPESIKSMTFINALHNKGRFTDVVKNIPINLVIDHEFGLFSSACKAHLISKSSENIL